MYSHKIKVGKRGRRGGGEGGEIKGYIEEGKREGKREGGRSYLTTWIASDKAAHLHYSCAVFSLGCSL